jgi:hypothetical protein
MDFMALKNPLPSARSEPANPGPNGKHSTTRPPRVTFEPEARLNMIYEFSPYLKENTTCHHNKH